VIATHNRRESLAVCLEALLASEYPDFEVIVVDNAPKDNTTLDFIRDHYGDASQSGRKVRYVREDRPGLGRAHNAGLPHVTTRHVVFTDDDVLVDRYWLLEMVKGFSMADNVACVTGLILPAELETQAQVWIEQYGGFSKGFTRRCFDLNSNRPPNSPLYPYTAGVFGSGASMAFDTAVLRHLGGFDAALGAGTQALGGDDLAAFFHVVQNGYRLVYEPAAILHHSHRREYAGLRRQAYGYGVGLTAYLTKVVLDHPRLIMDMALRLPAGLAHIFSSKSPKNKHKQADYPKELNTLERKGMLYGPLAYWRSRRAR
jgi:GT2 family glycosyltransferase